jgi:D-xylonolactonase
MTMFPTPDCIWDLKAGLGEGLVWVEAQQALYGVDILGRMLHRYVPDTDQRTSWVAPSRPTFLVETDDGGLLCGHEDGLRRFEPGSGRFGRLHPIEALLPDNRLNDAHVDGQGRLWFGTMNDPELAATGSLYRLDRLDPLEPHRMDDGYVVSNGPAIDSPRGRLYHNDSARQIIYAFDLAEDGSLSGKRIFARLEHGYPDGMTVDADGMLWVALYAGGGVQRFDADGGEAGFVALPCDNVTKIVFGGRDYRTAYVSTARKGQDAATVSRQPLAGGIFSFRTDTAGLPQMRFRV